MCCWLVGSLHWCENAEADDTSFPLRVELVLLVVCVCVRVCVCDGVSFTQTSGSSSPSVVPESPTDGIVSQDLVSVLVTA